MISSQKHIWKGHASCSSIKKRLHLWMKVWIYRLCYNCLCVVPSRARPLIYIQLIFKILQLEKISYNFVWDPLLHRNSAWITVYTGTKRSYFRGFRKVVSFQYETFTNWWSKGVSKAVMKDIKLVRLAWLYVVMIFS